MKRILATAVIMTLSTTAAWAEMVSKTSAHSVDATIDRLAAAVEGAGAKVFARIDHAQGAQSVGTDMRPTTLLIFGNPALGTPAMTASQTAGLDLPLRALAYEDADGTVHLVYHSPQSLAATHGIPADAEVIGKMTGALGNLTDKATGSE